MDAKTQEQRRLNKIQARRSAEKRELTSLDFGARGMGRKNRPSEHFPTKRCDHVTGGKAIFLRRKKANPAPNENPIYKIRIIKGGTRCPSPALIGTKCLEHLSDLKQSS